jgi:hypothetical protein
MFDRAYRTLRELQQKAAEPKKQKSQPEPPEPPKPNGGIRIARVPERAQPCVGPRAAPRQRARRAQGR